MEVIKCENLQVKYGNEVVISDANFALDMGRTTLYYRGEESWEILIVESYNGFCKGFQGKGYNR